MASLLTSCSKTTPQGVTMTKAVDGDVADIVAATVATAAASKRRVLVVVGAPWCEPCVRFHDAVAKGAFDDVLAGVDVVEFNMDVDRTRLEAAGYSGRMIPLMVLANADGTASTKHLEGSVKSEAAVADLRGRLSALLR